MARDIILTEFQIKQIIDATSDKDVYGGLILFWLFVLGKPLTSFKAGEIKAADYRISSYQYGQIFKGCLQKLKKVNHFSFNVKWMDIGPARIV